MRKPTILMMNRVYPPVRGASGRILRDMARGFARDGWQVTVITSGPRALNERDGAVRVIRVKSSGREHIFSYMLVWIKMLFAAFKLPATEIVVTMSDPPLLALVGGLIKLFKKNKHIHWVQDVYPDLFPVIGVKFPVFLLKIMRRLVHRSMMAADKVVVIGRCMARRLAHGGIAPRQIAVIPNWPDIELSQDDGGDDNSAFEEVERAIANSGRAENYRRHDAQLKTGPRFRVLYAGNIGRIHPIGVVLDAARILQNQHPEIEFLFVGDGPKYDAITRAKAQEHLDNVRLLPYQPPARLKALMESGDVHLISMEEGAVGMSVPSKLYSGIAAHRPCIFIGPRASESAKVIDDYKIGQIIEHGQAEQLADAIRAYRLDGDKWYAAHQNAAKAAAVFVPSASIHAFIERAWALVGGKPDDDFADTLEEGEVRHAAE